LVLFKRVSASIMARESANAKVAKEGQKPPPPKFSQALSKKYKSPTALQKALDEMFPDRDYEVKVRLKIGRMMLD
jgi:hypothetical protein